MAKRKAAKVVASALAVAQDRVSLATAPYGVLRLIYDLVTDGKEIHKNLNLTLGQLRDTLEELVDEFQGEFDEGQTAYWSDAKTKKEELERVSYDLQDAEEGLEWLELDEEDWPVRLQDCDIRSGNWTDEQRRRIELALQAA